MNKSGRLCVAALSMMLADPASALPGFRPMARQGGEQATYLHARLLAVRLVQEARPRLDWRSRAMAGPVLAALARARFSVSTDARSRHTCRSRNFSLFVNVGFRDVIFVCDEVRDHARDPDEDALARIAQGFVHEAVHLTGQMDECEASRFELSVMKETIGVRYPR